MSRRSSMEFPITSHTLRAKSKNAYKIDSRVDKAT